MSELIESLQIKLQTCLQECLAESDVIRRSEKAVTVIADLIEELKHIYLSGATTDNDSIIQLNKHAFPAVYAEYIYFGSIYNLEREKPFDKRCFDYYLREQEQVGYFVEKHLGLLNYYKSGKTHYDKIYFGSNNRLDEIYPEDFILLQDQGWPCKQSMILAKGWAYQRLYQYLDGKLQQFNKTNLVGILSWSRSKTDLVELVYALHAAQSFNKGNISLKKIALFFETAMGIDLGNTTLRFQEILRRKKSTLFLESLRDQLEAYISQIDQKKRR